VALRLVALRLVALRLVALSRLLLAPGRSQAGSRLVALRF